MIKAYSDDSRLWFVFPDNVYELEDSYEKEPRSCDFRKDYYHDVMNVDGIKKISLNDIEPFQQKGLLLFLFGELSWEW